MIKNYIEKANFEDTGFSYALSLISANTRWLSYTAWWNSRWYGSMNWNGIWKTCRIKRLAAIWKSWKQTGSLSEKNIHRYRPRLNTAWVKGENHWWVSWISYVSGGEENREGKNDVDKGDWPILSQSEKNKKICKKLLTNRKKDCIISLALQMQRIHRSKYCWMRAYSSAG